jgi:hypothetical protein
VASSEIDIEQRYLTDLYAGVDGLRERAATRLAAGRAAGADPDVVAFWQAELTRLRSVEDGLCFGRWTCTTVAVSASVGWVCSGTTMSSRC